MRQRGYCISAATLWAVVIMTACTPYQLSPDQSNAIDRAIANAPESSKHVYYTEEQRLTMGQHAAAYMLSERSFLLSPRGSIVEFDGMAASSAARELISYDRNAPECLSSQRSADAQNIFKTRISMPRVAQLAAQDFSERYSDQQIAELYRVALAHGQRDDLSKDLFPRRTAACKSGIFCDVRPFINHNSPSSWALQSIKEDFAQNHTAIEEQLNAMYLNSSKNPVLLDRHYRCHYVVRDHKVTVQRDLVTSRQLTSEDGGFASDIVGGAIDHAIGYESDKDKEEKEHDEQFHQELDRIHQQNEPHYPRLH